ncbi:hypothetical protein E4T52_13406 [Aureobasidium sp. EXF-3400]|nr:hypothetical protein E4T51_12453 [Aureobasidium sp. EXF-12344]KAI4771611.1 hypothetical protein E4T52_13406 [Aureobasidium sp. EXF-3400]
MLVNREWAEAGSYILWKCPPVTALAAVSPDRRQYYANKISELFFEGEDDSKHHATFKDLSFPRLKIVHVARVKLEKHEQLYLTQYMQPQLMEFHFWGGGICENALTTLASNCPTLEELNLEDPIDESSQDQLLDFFTSHESLEVIHLGHGWTELVTPELFAGLASLESLEKLDIRPLAEDHAILMGLGMSPDPFSKLQNLHMRVESGSVAHLASAAPSLSILFLIIEHSDDDALASLKPLSNLTHLELTFLDDTELSPQGFRALENLKGLEVLLIESRGALLEATWMDDGIFAEFISNLPNLTSLDFKLDCDITIETLTSLARTHPNMESFDFFGEFDLSDWSRLTNPLFPSLVRFVIEAPFVEGRTRSLAEPQVPRTASELYKSQMFCFATVRS